jgi:3-ketosteroid 9alpha-monooxygenase subunit A
VWSEQNLSPFPSGWFAVGSVADITAGQIKTLSYFGRELIAFRNGENKICVLNSYCVHLGAQLGVGGRLENDSVICPFHSWK